MAAHRLAAATGFALAAAAAAWWLGSTRLALDHGTDAGRSAADVLYALALVRGMALAMLVVRVTAARGWQPGLTTTLGLLAPSWPVVTLAWSASTISVAQVAGTECLLLAGGLLLTSIGIGLRRLLRPPELAVVAATGLGIALAALAWVTRGVWCLAQS